MFNKLVQFEAFYQLKQRAFPIFVILFFALGFFVGRQGYAPKGVNFNSIYQVYFHSSIFTLGSVFVIMFFAISAMLRDKQHNMDGLVYSSSVKKSYYFWSRFLGTFIFSVLAFSPFILGYIFGNHFTDLDSERIGNFQLLNYLQPWLYIVVPNIFICSTIVFSVSTLTKNSTATYVSAVFIYMLYFVSSLFLNSPLMAQAVPASPESMAMAAVADPFGIAAFFEQTQYWTPFQKNSQLLSLSGLFLWNRLVWVSVSFGVLLTTYRLFTFRKISKKVKKEKPAKIKNTAVFQYRPLHTIQNYKAQMKAFLSLLKLELRSVFKSLPFIAVLIMWLSVVYSELYATIVGGGEYDVSVYPFTNQLIELMVNPLTLFSLILIIFYSAEIVWRERDLNFNSIVDATPVKNGIFFLSKFGALLLLPIILLTIGIIMCIGFQIALGYFNFEFDLYISVYYHYGVQLAVFSMIALFVHSLVKNKYLGMGIFGLIVLLSLKASLLGLEHPLTSLGFIPRVSYNNMDGFNGVSNLYNHLALYWLGLGLLLVFISFKIWNRGAVKTFLIKLKHLKFGWSTVQKTGFAVCLLLFIGAGSLVFYNVNVVSKYETVTDSLDFMENYEKNYKKYEVLERPITISRYTEVAIYPSERRYTIDANYILKNKREEAMSEIFITERIPLERISIENAILKHHDANLGTYLFQFKNPIQPNDSIRFTYKLEKKVKGYEVDRTIVENGTYISHNSFEPMLGYSSGMEITNRMERQKRNLPKRIEEENTASHIVLEDFKFEKTRFETIVSTDADQTALSSGSLMKEWTEDGRNFYHFLSKEKTMPIAAYFSAKYSTQKTIHNGVSIEQYFDEDHDFNIDDVENSVKHTLDYCQENFGSYAFDHVRIAEIPGHWGFGGFAHPGVISMVEDRLYLANVSDKETFNLVAKRTIHEVAHQWWGHTLNAKPVAGGSLFVEGLAKYTEAVVLEKMYGKRALYQLKDNTRRRYFSGRAFDGDPEPGIYLMTNQSYLSYGKALTVFLGLRDLMEEERLNNVLKAITDRYRDVNKLQATTIELLDEIYKVTPKKQHVLVNDWFKKVITYDLAIEEASFIELPNGTFEITAKVKTKRFETLDSGEAKQIVINEPIKIGVFSVHPSTIIDEDSILYYESNQFNKEMIEVKIIVNEQPRYIEIDPYGTRTDENLVDNSYRF